MIGKTVSHYRVVERVGSGGMGDVYRAVDEALDRRVALKFLRPSSNADAEARKRFLREARSASSLDHPNICTVYEVGETPEGLLFIAMAYYGGRSLAEKLREGPMEIGEALDIAIQAARGLAKAHENGILHRDIKPANLVLTEDGLVKIVDFGLARLTGSSQITRTGTSLGTLAYMSPEQVRGDKVDQRTDVWALGVVLYEMLTGVSPFAGDQQASTIYGILEKQPTPLSRLRPGLPGRFEEVIVRALGKNAESRYGSVDEWLVDLEGIRSELNSETESRFSRRSSSTEIVSMRVLPTVCTSP